MRKLTMDEVEFEVVIEPEDMTFEGNCMASGDDEIDAEQEKWIRDQLNSGNDLAWCYVVVIARWEGFEGSDTLGGVSCADWKDLEEGIVAAHDMRQTALDDLNEKIAQTYSRLSKLA